MKALLLLSVCLLCACAATEPRFPPANLAAAGTTDETLPDPTASGRDRGRRAALWTGIGFALFAIYEANDDDDVPQAPAAGGLCLNPGLSIKCW